MKLANPLEIYSGTHLDSELMKKLYSHATIGAGIYFIIAAAEQLLFHGLTYLSIDFIFLSFSFLLIYVLIPYSTKSYNRGIIFFYILIFGGIIVDFISNGNLYSPTLFIYYPLTVIILFLTKKTYVKYLVILLLMTGTALIAFSYFRPNIIATIPKQSEQIIERTVSLILSLIFTVYLITEILNQYILDKQRAFKSEKAKSEFLTDMSHMIRTPLNSINGFADFLLDDEITATEKRYFISRMQKNAKDLNILISDLVDLSIIQEESLKLDSTSFPINNLISELEAKAQLEIYNYNIQIVFSLVKNSNVENIILHTDYKRLLQSLWKIIENGIKFTEKGYVKMGVELRKDKSLLFTISDSGIGITLEQQQHLFDPIYKQNSGFKTEDTSPGLGLNIANGIIAYLGGTINISSQFGSGTQVFISLPANTIK